MRLRTEFAQLPLRFDVGRLRAEVAALDEVAWRPHPQGHPGNSALPLIAVDGDPHDDGVAGAMLPTPHLERCEYLRQVLVSLQTVLGRTRLMRLDGHATATRHVDVNYYWAERVRVHVPITTSPEIRFSCGDQERHLPAGEAWIFDASRPHDVVNPTGAQRIHLVADTVGSSAFWSLVEAGAAGAEPRLVAHRPGAEAWPETERVNRAAVMGPWEQQALLRELLAAIPESADRAALAGAAAAFARDWRALWARYGDDRSGHATYAARRDDLAHALLPLAGRIMLGNGTDAVEMLQRLVLEPALASPAARSAPPALPRPLIIVAPPRSGSSLVFETLARAPGVFTVGGESHDVIEGIEELHPAARGWDSNRLTRVDARPEVVAALRARFTAALRDRDGAGPGEPAPRLLEKTPKNALRVSFLDAVFPDACFVYLHRDPRETLGSMLDAWASARFVTYPDLPGWPGAPWSLALAPEWRALAGRAPAELVAGQWAAIVRTALDDLDALDPQRWMAVDYAAFVADPADAVRRICAFAGLAAPDLPDELPLSRHTLTPPRPDKWRRHEAALAPLLPGLDALAERSRATVDRAPGSAAPPRPARDPLRSVATSSLPELLEDLGSSALVSTYQSGRIVLLRGRGGVLNTHFRELPGPMGIAHEDGRLAVATVAGVTEYRDVAAVAARLDGAHDACYVPRRTHITGDVRAHDIAYAGGELWVVATRFSCLATLDDEHSFVPRWRPPFVTALAGEDRCHLNGLAVRDGKPSHVTALGASDEPEGWRGRRADGGVLIDVATGATVLDDLAMPHSPRWHDGRLWMLESGRGTLAVVDLQAGTHETVAQLPGFTRGLAFAGRWAFVGLSQVREATTFGGLPLTARLEARESGVWVVDTGTGELVAFVRFEGDVQEVFDVCVLDGRAFPEIAEPDSTATHLSYVVPDDALAG